MEKLPERKSALVRSVGVSAEKEREFLERVGKFFSTEQKFREHEVEKTQEQKEVVKFVNEKMQEFVRSFSAEPLNITGDKVHLVAGEFFPVQPGHPKETSAFYHVQEQSVYIKDEKGLPLSGFTKRLIHEFMHFNSLLSLQVKEENGKLIPIGGGVRRIGFKLEKRGEKGFVYFYNLDEAVIEELTKRFSKKFLRQSPLLKKGQEEIDTQVAKMPAEAQKKAEDISFVKTTKEGDLYKTTLHTYSYVKERKNLNRLIDELYEHNKDSYQSREEIFNLFAQAVMNGRLLPVARLIEKTFGKGSFKQLGERTGKSLIRQPKNN